MVGQLYWYVALSHRAIHGWFPPLKGAKSWIGLAERYNMPVVTNLGLPLRDGNLPKARVYALLWQCIPLGRTSQSAKGRWQRNKRRAVLGGGDVVSCLALGHFLLNAGEGWRSPLARDDGLRALDSLLSQWLHGLGIE